MSTRTIIADPVAERASTKIRAQLLDLDGAEFEPDELTMTLYDLKSKEIINERSKVDVTEAMDDSGAVALELTPADNAVLGTGAIEYHVLLLEWAWAEGRQGRHEIQIAVHNMAKVP